MPQNLSPASPPGSFNIGNIVSVGLQLYRSHFKSYFSIALMATLWIIFPFLLSGILVGVLFATQAGPGWYVLILLLAIVLGVYCSAKALMNTALISRLAFGELLQKPESVRAARQQLNHRLWGVFWAQFLANLILAAASFTLSLLQTVIFGGVGLLFRNIVVLYAMITIIGNLIYLVVYLWVYSRFFIPEVPIAVEENIGAASAVGRSWELSKHSSGRILGVIGVAVLITLPFYALSAAPMISGLLAIAPFLNDPDSILFAAPNVLQQLAIAFLIGFLLFFIINLVVMPFWQTIKAVLYYDLRSRLEGLDLRLRDLDS